MKRCDNIFDPSISQNTWMYSFQFKTKLQRRSRFQLVSIHLVNHLHPFVLGISPQKSTATLRNPQNGGRLHNYAPITEEPDLRWAVSWDGGNFLPVKKILPVYGPTCVPPPFSLWIHWGGKNGSRHSEWVSHNEWSRFGGDFRGGKTPKGLSEKTIHSQELP